MRKYLILLDRELKSYFYSPVAYIVLFFFIALSGYNLYTVIKLINGRTVGIQPMEIFFNWVPFWFTYIIVIPLITMRLYAEEFQMGTIETLMTAPVRDWQVVAAKFSGAFVFYMMLWISTVLDFLVFQWVTNQPFTTSFGSFAGSYLILAVMGTFYLSIGCVASALTRNQIVAAIISLVTIIMFFFTGAFGVESPNLTQGMRELITYFSSIEHMEEFTRGLIDTRPIVFYLSFAILLQVLTFQIIQYRKWRF